MTQAVGEGSSSSAERYFNPAFVHSVAVPEVDTLAGLNKICAVARGDGVVDVIEIESELAVGSKDSRHLKKSQGKIKDNKKQATSDDVTRLSPAKRIELDYAFGGHTAAVSCVSFSLFGEKGRLLISGGNDALVKVWEWSKYSQKMETSSKNEIALNIDVKRKVNWLCTIPSDSENLIVCDTSKVLKAYTVS